MAWAWDTIGRLRLEFLGDSFRGEGRVLAGVHDSNANYLRYLAAGLAHFTLLSTGTWIIGFDNSTPLSALDPARDTVSNTDVFGRQVASCRFYGGREFEILARGAPAEVATVEAASRLVRQGTFALPSFTDSGGPVPRSGGKGRIVGPAPQSAEEDSALAALYCALMVAESLDAIGSRHDVIIDGPFSRNGIFVGMLAALRPQQRLLVSDLREGTTAGAACLALMPDGRLPRIALELRTVVPARIEAMAAYHESWRMGLPQAT
jgi:sugar (pentulose or hexulose) kinase